MKGNSSTSFTKQASLTALRKKKRVALVHDDLVQWGGAERVLLGLSKIFPDAPIYTSVYDSSNKLLAENFSHKKIKTSFIQKIPGWKFLYKALLPFYPLSFESFNFDKYDIVISQTTRFSKSIITKPETLHLSYCHTPPRFLWHLSRQKPPIILEPILSFLRLYDLISSSRVDHFLAGSENAKKRIKKFYQRDSTVLYPFIDLERFKNIKTKRGDYFLVIARLTDYKRVDISVKAFNRNGLPLKIIGVGPELEKLKSIAKSNIQFLESVSEKELLETLASCKGLIVTAEEDFGLTPLEAQALGKGVIALGRGGALETVIAGKTGVFFPLQNSKSLEEAIKKYNRLKVDPKVCIKNAQKFSYEQFRKVLLQKIRDYGYDAT